MYHHAAAAIHSGKSKFCSDTWRDRLRRLRDAHHHSFWPRQLAAGINDLIVPEGPSFISRTVARPVWTGYARDTIPISDLQLEQHGITGAGDVSARISAMGAFVCSW